MTDDLNAQYFAFGSPNSAIHKSPLPDEGSLLDTSVQHPFSAPSSASPAGSSPDSSSNSSGYKRKSSSESSRSGLTADAVAMRDTDMGDWQLEEEGINGHGITRRSSYGTIDPSSLTKIFDFNDKSMENDFDFESATSSPSPFGTKNLDTDALEMPTVKRDLPRKRSPMVNTRFKNHKPAHSVGFGLEEYEVSMLIISSNIL